MEINAKTKVCGLIGYPVGHSVSPVIHNTLAELYGHNLVYVPLQTKPGCVGEAVRGADAFDFLGMNVTVPYKSEVLPYLKDIDPLAKQIGAVNTLVRVEDGYKGYNTDMPGLARAMESDGISLEGQSVIILGAGGVARAVAYLLLEKKAKKVYVLNRSVERARQLAEEVNRAAGSDFLVPLGLSDFAEIPAGKKYLTIQATKVGMYPEVDACAIEDPAFYELVSAGYDLIFNPMNTKFMQLVKASGAPAFHGLKMLLYQGIIAYELWNKTQIADKDALYVYDRMKAALGVEEAHG